MIFACVEDQAIVLITVLKNTIIKFLTLFKVINLKVFDVLYTVINNISNILDYVFE